MAKDKAKSDPAANIIRNHTLAAIGAGLLPVPLLEIALITGIQLRMLSRLAAHYKVEFSKQRAKAIIASLLGVSATATGTSLLKLVPGVGQTLAMIGVPVFAGASTIAIGKVFVRHFESGGTFVTFDAEKAREYYEAEYEEATVEIRKEYIGVKP